MTEEVLPVRVYVELPSGKWFVPGQSPACPGPTPTGECSIVAPGAVRPCAGGVWFMPGERGWRFKFVDDSSVCPVSVLDPLGLPPVPLD